VSVARPGGGACYTACMVGVRILRLFPLLGAVACGLDWSGRKAAPDAASASADAAPGDAGEGEPEADAALLDVPDAGDFDAGDLDAGVPDAGNSAAGNPDAGDAGNTSELPSTGLALWLRADRGVEADALGVSAWVDQATGARATQPLSDQRPAFRAGSDGTRAALVFDGANDVLRLPPVSFDFSAGLTVFAVELNAETTGDVYQPFVELSNGKEVDDVSFGRFRRQLLFEVDLQDRFSRTIPADVVQVVSARLTPALVLEMRKDGALWATYGYDHLPAQVARSEALIGASLYGSGVSLGGELYEVAIYTRALSDDEWTAAERAMSARWRCCGAF